MVPDVSGMSELLGAGLILMAISAPITVALLKLINGKDRRNPCNNCDRLEWLIHRLENAVDRMQGRHAE